MWPERDSSMQSLGSVRVRAPCEDIGGAASPCARWLPSRFESCPIGIAAADVRGHADNPYSLGFLVCERSQARGCALGMVRI